MENGQILNHSNLTQEEIQTLKKLSEKNPEIQKLMSLYSEDPEKTWDRILLLAMSSIEHLIKVGGLNLVDDKYSMSLFEIVKTKVGAPAVALKRDKGKKEKDAPTPEQATEQKPEEKEPETFAGPIITPETAEKNVPRD